MSKPREPTSLQTTISVAVAVGVGIAVSRALEPTWGLWGFVAALAAGALVAVGLEVLFVRSR